MAKFKGDSEDWLDDERSSRKSGNQSRKRLRNKALENAKTLAWSEANGTVVEVFPKLCRVKFDQGAELSGEAAKEVLCHYRRAQVFGASQRAQSRGEVRERTPVAVGDRVLADPARTLVESVCERKNFLSRPAPGRTRPKRLKGKDEDDGDETKLVQILAANLDCVAIVACAGMPEFTPGLVDRYLVACQNAGIAAVICINKMDLPVKDRPWQLYSDLGFAVREISSKTGLGIDSLRQELAGKTVAFCGQSGVGKTSLLQTLTRTARGRVGDVSESTAKGMHTTTSAIMLPETGLPPGTQWIDTPGVREFGLVDLRPEDLARFFPEFAQLSCHQRGCTHEGETDCQARGLPRYPSFERMLVSLRENT